MYKRRSIKLNKNKLVKKRQRAGLFFLAPSFLGVIIFVLLPFGDVIRRSFITAITNQFIGIQNYKIVLVNEAFIVAVKNTFRFTLTCIPILVILGLFISLALMKTQKIQVIKSFYLLPLAIPTATIVLVWKMIFHKYGFLNGFLSSLASTLVTTDYMNTELSFYVLAGTYIWKNLGYTIILWMAGIQGVSGDIMEAAKVDGAGKWKRLVYIMLPNLKGSLYTIVVLSFLNSFKIYREAYLVAGSYPDDNIYLLQHLFNNWFVNLELDKMASAAVIVGGFLFIIIMLLQKLWDKD